MKYLTKIAVFLLVLMAYSCVQQKSYVAYEVKKGESMSAIAKRYQMTEGELLRINPGIGKNPPAKTLIIVPRAEKNTITKDKTPSDKEESTQQKANTYAVYTVAKGDTLFTLSKRFDTTIEQLKDINPILKDGLKEGMELLYIVKDTATQQSLGKLHEVVKGDTVYNLTKRYEISEQELYDANPTLSEGLKIGMILRIPEKEEELTDADMSMEMETIEKESAGSPMFVENLSTEKSANIAVFLPYQVNKLTSDEVIEAKLKSKNSLTSIATDFHQGVLMAVDSLQSRGVQVNVSFFDTENSKTKLTKLMFHQDFSSYDAIIGPLFFDKAQLVASQLDLPVVLPFYSKSQHLYAKDNLIKSVPNKEVVEKKLINYIKNNHKDEKIIVVTDNKQASKSQLFRVVEQLKAIKSISKVAVLKPKRGYIDRESFDVEIKEGTSHWVILVGDNSVTISDVVTNLGVYPKEEYKIRLFAFEKGEVFDKVVDNNYLAKLNFTYPTSDYNNIFNSNTKLFYEKFKEQNHTLPSKYAIRGFDLTYDVVARLVSYQTFTEGMQQGKSSRLTSIFDYRGNENNGVVLVKYNEDLQIEIVE